MKVFALLAAVLLPLAALSQTEPAAEPEACPPETAQQVEARKRTFLEDRRRARRVSANVGVDALGRALLAVDLDRDGMADELVLFTPRQRLEGPWSQLVPVAEYETTRGTLRFEASDRSLAISLAVEPADPPAFRLETRPQARIVQEAHGSELAISRPGAEVRRYVESYDHTLIETWPESFRDDLVVPGTSGATCLNCSGTPCQTGGCYASGCERKCSGIVANHQCGISCNIQRAFACCNCTNGILTPIADCRCVACIRATGPIP